METYKKIVTNYVYFCSSTMLTGADTGGDAGDAPPHQT